MAQNVGRTPGRVSVGITGHRFLAELDRINAGIAEGVARVRAAYNNAPVTVLSALAEGADRLAAEVILATDGAALTAVIPFSLADYEIDFGPEGSASRLHFHVLLQRASETIVLPDAESRNAGYAAGGQYVLDNADVLLAIWDGEGAQGQGGTGEIVALAREQGKPVVIVRAGNRKPGTHEPTTLGPEQGRVILERLPIY